MKQPGLGRGDDFYLRAFWELSSCRQFGEVMGPIPWNFLIQYAERAGLDAGMIRVFEVVIRELDEAYLEHLRTEREQKRSEALNRVNRAKRVGKRHG